MAAKLERDLEKMQAELLRAIRGKLSTSALSAKLGYKFNQVARWEKGERRLLWTDFVALCEARRLPLAAQLAEDGIAVNALWPRTIIATAALNVALPGGGQYGRKPDIMADAAHRILTRDSRSTNGNFFIDEEVLRAGGITDFSQYLVTPGVEPMIDLFVEAGNE